MKIFTKTITFFILTFLSWLSINAQTKPIVKDDPHNRVIYETRRLINPTTGEIPDNIRGKELDFAKQLPKNSLKSSNAVTWTHRGPFNVGGRTRALAIDKANENIILAGGVSGGMWRSTNGGSSWTKVTALDDLHSVTAIAQDPNNTNTWYYGTGEISGNSARASGAPYRGNGIFKSTDNGISWTQLASTSSTPESFNSDFQYCWNIKVSPTNSYVYAATYGRIYRSTDAGVNWTAVFTSSDVNLASPSSSSVTDLNIDSNGNVYIAIGSDGDIGGFYLSQDNGNSWTNITPDNTTYPDFPTDYNRTVIDIAPSNENVVYFLTYVNTDANDNPIHSLWKYTYDPNTSSYSWTDLSANIPAQGNLTGNFDSQGGYDLLIKVRPSDENFVIIGGTDLWRSTDGFSTTNNLTKIGGYLATNTSYSSYSNHHPDQHSLVFYPSDDKKVISGHDGGLSLTTDITNSTVGNNDETVVWSSLNAGYLTTQAYAIALDMQTNGNPVIVAGFQDNGSWRTDNTFGTASWFNVGGGDGAYCAVINEGNEYYQSSQNGTVYRNWLDAGSWKWTQVDPDGAADQDFINPFILDPNDTKIMYYLGGKIIWRNENLTQIPEYSNNSTLINWDKMNQTDVGTDWISNLDISTNPANILYYCTYGGKVYKVENANTGDPTPTEITGNNFPSATIGCVKVNPYDTSEILVSFTNYEVISIWHTSDGGQNWESVSGNLEQNLDGTGSGPSVRWVEMLKKDNGDKVYFAGTSTGLYTTTTLNGDNTVWTQESPDLIGNVVVDMIKVRKDGTVVIGTHGNGVYSALYDGATSVTENKFTDLIDAKIYPNPSNGEFTIEAQTETPANYQVIIYNMNGQPVYYGEEKSVSYLKQQVNLQKHAKGLYTVEIVKNRNAFTYKILLK